MTHLEIASKHVAEFVRVANIPNNGMLPRTTERQLNRARYKAMTATSRLNKTGREAMYDLVQDGIGSLRADGFAGRVCSHRESAAKRRANS